jgi:hypothetical protein
MLLSRFLFHWKNMCHGYLDKNKTEIANYFKDYFWIICKIEKQVGSVD